MKNKERIAVVAMALLGVVALGAATWVVLAGRSTPIDARPPVAPADGSAAMAPVERSPGPRPNGPDHERTSDRGAVDPAEMRLDRGPPDPATDEVLTASYDELKRLLDRRDWRALRSAVKRSGGIVDEQFVRDLIAMLSSPKDRDVARSVLELVTGRLDMLAQAYHDTDDAAVKGLAMDAMAVSAGEEALPNLLGYLSTETDEGLVRRAARAVALVGNADAVDGLVAALEHNVGRPVQSGLTEALGQVRDPEGVGRIISALEKAERPEVKLALIESLEIAKQPASVPILSRLASIDDGATTQDREIAHRAVSALGAVGDEAATRRLLDLAETEGPLRSDAFAALQNSRATTMASELATRLDATHDDEYRAGLMMAIGRTRNRDYTERLIHLAVSDPTVDGRRAAVRALGEMKDPFAIPTLEAILADGRSHDNLKFEAVSTIARIGDHRGIVVLERIVEPSPITGRPSLVVADSVKLNAKRQLAILRARVSNPLPK